MSVNIFVVGSLLVGLTEAAIKSIQPEESVMITYSNNIYDVMITLMTVLGNSNLRSCSVRDLYSIDICGDTTVVVTIKKNRSDDAVEVKTFCGTDVWLRGSVRFVKVRIYIYVYD